MDIEAVRDPLNIMFQHFTFYFTEWPKKVFALLHEYIIWSTDPACTDVAAEVAPWEPLLWLLRHHCAPTHWSGLIFASWLAARCAACLWPRWTPTTLFETSGKVNAKYTSVRVTQHGLKPEIGTRPWCFCYTICDQRKVNAEHFESRFWIPAVWRICIVQNGLSRSVSLGLWLARRLKNGITYAHSSAVTHTTQQHLISPRKSLDQKSIDRLRAWGHHQTSCWITCSGSKAAFVVHVPLVLGIRHLPVILQAVFSDISDTVPLPWKENPPWQKVSMCTTVLQVRWTLVISFSGILISGRSGTRMNL